MMDHDARIFVTGHRVMVGGVIVRQLLAGGREPGQECGLSGMRVSQIARSAARDALELYVQRLNTLPLPMPDARDKAIKVAAGAPLLLVQARALLSTIEARNHG